MAKGVLGNDPFLRGAPKREETAITTPQKPAPQTPEPKPIAPAKPRRPPRAAAAAAPKQGKKGWPKAAQQNEPARASVRQMMSQEPERTPVLSDPPKRLSDWEPTSHDGSPQMVVLVRGVATPHPGSPDLIAQLGEPPDRIKDFLPHPHSPHVEAVLGTSEVVAPLRDRAAVPHALSPEVVEVQAAARRRPLVVEITERTQPDAPMSEREISAVPRSSRPVLALGVARDFFSGGIVRPIAGAASGIFQAVRTALGASGSAELDVWAKICR